MNMNMFENLQVSASEVIFWNSFQWITVTPEIRRVIANNYTTSEEDTTLAFNKKVSQKREIECKIPLNKKSLCSETGTYSTMGMCTKHYGVLMSTKDEELFRKLVERKAKALKSWNTTEMLLTRELRMLWDNPELSAMDRDKRLQMLQGGQPLGAQAKNFAEEKALTIISYFDRHQFKVEFSVEATNGKQRAKASYISREKLNGDVVWELKVNANPVPYPIIEREIREADLGWAFRISFDIPNKEDKDGLTDEFIAMRDQIIPLYTMAVNPAYVNVTDHKILLTYLMKRDGSLETDFTFTDHLPVDKAHKRMNVLWQQVPMHTEFTNTVFLLPDEPMPAKPDEDTIYIRVWPNPDLIEDWDGELYMSQRLTKRMLDNLKKTMTRGDSRVYRKTAEHNTFNFRGVSRMDREAHQKIDFLLKDKQKIANNPNGFFYLKGDCVVGKDDDAAILNGADIATIAENIAVEMGLTEQFTGQFTVQVNPQHSGRLKTNPQYMAAMGRALMMTPDEEGITQYERSLARKMGQATTRLITGQAGGDMVDRGAAFTDSDIGRFICENLGNTLPSLWATRESIEWELTALDIAQNKYEFWERYTWVPNAMLWSLRTQATMDALMGSGEDDHEYHLVGNQIGLNPDYHSVIVGRDIVKLVMESLGGADKDDHVGVIIRKLTKDYTFKAGDYETHFKAGEVIAILVRFPLGMRAHEGKVGAEFWMSRLSMNYDTQSTAAPFIRDAIEVDPDLLPHHVFELPTPQFNDPRPPTRQATLEEKFELSAELIGGYGRISIASSALLFLGSELERKIEDERENTYGPMPYEHNFTVPGSMEFYIDTFVQLRHPDDLRASIDHYDQMRDDVIAIANKLGYIDPIINTRMGLKMDHMVQPSILSDAIVTHMRYEDSQRKALTTFKEGYFNLFEELAQRHQPDYLNDTLLGNAYSARRAIPQDDGTTWTARHDLIAKQFADQAENVTTNRVKQAIVLQGMDIADLRQGRRHMLTVSASVFSPYFAPRVVNALTKQDVQSLNDLLDLSETYAQILSDMEEDGMDLLTDETRKAFVVSVA